MKKILIILLSLISLSQLVANEFHASIRREIEAGLSERFGCKITLPQPLTQTEESNLRNNCHKVKMQLVQIHGWQIAMGGTVKMYQTQYLQSVGTPTALRLLAELQKTMHGF